MNFINQFNKILNTQEVLEEASFIINQGKKQSPFINYFGVNYNDDNIVSLKLYFSFFQKPSQELIDKFKLTSDLISLVDKHWKPSNSYDYMHQGLTFGLKCYLKNDIVQINKYIHFRKYNELQSSPKHTKMASSENKNFPGYCVEFHGDKAERKNYYYYTSKKNIHLLLEKFGVEPEQASKISLIEYTESDFEKKINIRYDNSDDVKSYLKKLNNRKINELNKYLYDNYNLYFFAPGIRHKSETNAIYYVSKNTYYSQFEENSIEILLKLFYK